MELWSGCIAGALLTSEYVHGLEQAGFVGRAWDAVAKCWIGEGDDFSILDVFDGIFPYSIAWAGDPAGQAHAMCDQLLVNKLIEDYTVEVDG
mgnify:CR=1 FL=1